MSVLLSADVSGFSRKVQDWAAASGKTLSEAFRTHGRLLAAELIKRTPPHSGKSIVRMLSAQGKSLGWRDAEIEDMTALQVGKRRVEKDIRKVIYGVRGAEMPKPAQVFRGQNRNQAFSESVIGEWGIRQRCQGKDAVRIFATKDGTVYGVDLERFDPGASMDAIAKTHKENRISRGRVTTAGQKERVIGRWKWMNVLVTKEAAVKRYIAQKIKMVGQARGGWAAAFMRLGGRMSVRGWVGRHSSAGYCNADFSKPYSPSIEMVNHSAWASNGDIDRVIAKSMEGRGKAIVKDAERILDGTWRKWK